VREQSEIIFDFASQHGVGPYALVWDPISESFYYDQHYSEFSFGVENPKSLDQIFGSADGAAWGMVSSTETESSPDYKSRLPSSYCAHNDCLDGLDQHVPDGVMFTDRTTATTPPPADDEPKIVTIKPTMPPVVFYYGGGVAHAWEEYGEVKRPSKMARRGESQVTIRYRVRDVCRHRSFRGFVSEDDVLSGGQLRFRLMTV
jgi:hypothetical protein